MNADQFLLRLKVFAPDTPILVSVPSGGAAGDRLLPITKVHHHGLAPDAIDHDRTLEIFTTPWEDDNPDLSSTVTIGNICARLALHRDEAHVRVGVTTQNHHRVMDVQTVGFAWEGVLINGKLPIQLIVEPWDGPNMIIRA